MREQRMALQRLDDRGDAIVTADWRGVPQIDYDEWADHAARGTLTDIIDLYARLGLFGQATAADTSKEGKEATDA